LKIEGCKTGKHLFVKKKQGAEVIRSLYNSILLLTDYTIKDETTQEESVICRIDHYQTPTQVLASVYAKKVDPQRSNITFEDERIHLDLFMPPVDALNNGPWKRFRKTVELFGRVKREECKYVILGTKVRISLLSVRNLMLIVDWFS
jgi:hypothetical protein